MAMPPLAPAPALPAGGSGAERAATLARNADLFIRFRLFFNVRFYYPVLAVLFVDLGLSLERYALLNVAWALAIVLLELPLGALGDQIGRRRMVVLASVLMVVEMAVLGFFPRGDADVLFYALLLNRVLSGAAEAAASGADEALAYDSLLECGRAGEWPRVLERLGRAMSLAFFGAMTLGALVYDPAVVGRALGALGSAAVVTQDHTVRLPVYLTLAMAIGALATALRMVEPGPTRAAPGAAGGATPTLADNLRGIARAAAFVAATPLALGAVLFYLANDALIRIFLTLTSTYYRLLAIPEAVFGVLGSAFALMGFVAAPLGRALVERRSPLARALASLALGGGGLLGCALVHHPAALVFVAPIGVSMHLAGFFVSHDLNRATPSGDRATVLSVKSLVGNLGYGALGWGFALLLGAAARAPAAAGAAPAGGPGPEEMALADALPALPLALAALAVLAALYAARRPALRAVAAAAGPAAADLGAVDPGAVDPAPAASAAAPAAALPREASPSAD